MEDGRNNQSHDFIRIKADAILKGLDSDLESKLFLKKQSDRTDDDDQQQKIKSTKIDGVVGGVAGGVAYSSWIRGNYSIEEESRGVDEDGDAAELYDYPTRRCQYFDTHGFAVVQSFADSSEVIAMKDQMQALVDEEWDPNNTKPTVFRTDEKQIDEQGSDDYFLESANQVHYFAEAQAMTTATATAASDKQLLKDEFAQNKILALNKAGHGMHVRPGAFHDYTTSAKVRTLVGELGWVDPVVPQSMYIFKQARVGGEVTSHQDSTFLYTTPKQSCLGLWLALDDATITNGCLWVRPGSHREKTRRKFVKNPDHFGAEQIKIRSNVAKRDLSQSQMIFLNEPDTLPIAWEGKIPNGDGYQGKGESESESESWKNLFAAGFVPVECNAGDLVVFPGELDHLSLPNTSDQQRHTFQLHMVEGEGTGVTWSPDNWLQYPKGVPFLRINTL